MAIIHDTTMSPGKLELLTAQLIALLQGTAEPQAQRVSSTPDPTVTVQRGEAGQPGLSVPWRLQDGTQVRGILATAEYVTAPRSGDH
jgi:hypothetical protein